MYFRLFISFLLGLNFSAVYAAEKALPEGFEKIVLNENFAAFQYKINTSDDGIFQGKPVKYEINYNIWQFPDGLQSSIPSAGYHAVWTAITDASFYEKEKMYEKQNAQNLVSWKHSNSLLEPFKLEWNNSLKNQKEFEIFKRKHEPRFGEKLTQDDLWSIVNEHGLKNILVIPSIAALQDSSFMSTQLRDQHKGLTSLEKIAYAYFNHERVICLLNLASLQPTNLDHWIVVTLYEGNNQMDVCLLEFMIEGSQTMTFKADECDRNTGFQFIDRSKDIGSKVAKFFTTFLLYCLPEGIAEDEGGLDGEAEQAIAAWVTTPKDVVVQNCTDFDLHEIFEQFEEKIAEDDANSMTTHAGSDGANCQIVHIKEKNKWPFLYEVLISGCDSEFWLHNLDFEKINEACKVCRLRVFSRIRFLLQCRLKTVYKIDSERSKEIDIPGEVFDLVNNYASYKYSCNKWLSADLLQKANDACVQMASALHDFSHDDVAWTKDWKIVEEKIKREEQRNFRISTIERCLDYPGNFSDDIIQSPYCAYLSQCRNRLMSQFNIEKKHSDEISDDLWFEFCQWLDDYLSLKNKSSGYDLVDGEYSGEAWFCIVDGYEREKEQAILEEENRLQQEKQKETKIIIEFQKNGDFHNKEMQKDFRRTRKNWPLWTRSKNKKNRDWQKDIRKESKKPSRKLAGLEQDFSLLAMNPACVNIDCYDDVTLRDTATTFEEDLLVKEEQIKNVSCASLVYDIEYPPFLKRSS